MTITNAELRVLAAEELGIKAGTMSLTSDQDDFINRRLTPMRAWLIEEGLTYWPEDAIPDAAAIPMAKILAGQCAELFGRGPKADDPYEGGAAGYAALERHCSQRSSKEPVKAEYF